MTHTITTSQFEGPLDLLLQLVERGNIEVTAISIADITSSYLDHIRQLEQQSPDTVSQFVQLGARLLYIKSLALLPAAAADRTDDELRQLNFELDQHRRFQQASRTLARRNLQTFDRTTPANLNPADLPLPALSLQQLSQAFTAALARAIPAPTTQVLAPHISLETKLSQLRAQLPAGFQLQPVLDHCSGQLEIIVTFLALLELIHHGLARITQANQFAPITVEAARV